MSCTKDNILTLGLIGGSLALFPFLDDPTKMFLELLLIGGQLGTQVWFNFIATPTMRANMAKKALGDIQSLLFPKFGLVGSGTSLMALVANWTRSKSSFWAQMFLGVSVVTNLVNTLALFPLTTKNQWELFAAREADPVDEERVKKASKKFGVVHGISVLLNFSTMAANLFFVYCVATSIK